MARVFEMLFNIGAKMQSSFSRSFLIAGERLAQLNTRVSSLKAEMKELDRQHKTGVISVREYGEAYAKLAVQLERAERAQKNYIKGQAIQERTDKFRGGARAAMLGTFETAVAVGGPIAVAMNFESAMAGIGKYVDGARDDAGKLTEVYTQAQDRIMQASKDMMIMPDTMAKAFSMAARSGVQGLENIDKFARMGIMMGTAFEAPAEEITEQFAKIGSARGISLATEDGIRRLEALADTVNYLDDQSNASGADIIKVLFRISGTATSLLPTLSDQTLAGMATALLQMGETSETAGTAINSLFTKVAAAQSQSKSFKDALAAIGYSAEDLQFAVSQDAEKAIFDLFQRIGQLDEISRNNVMAELFGQEHIDTLAKISGNYELFLELIKKGKSDAAKGSMAREFEIQSQITTRQLEGLKAAAARAAINLGGVLLPDIKMLAGTASWAADKLLALSKEHDSLANKIVRYGAWFLGGTVAVSAFSYAVMAIASPFVKIYGWLIKVGWAQKIWNAAMLAGRALWLTSKLTFYIAEMMVASIATKAWAAAQWAWNAAMLANPIGLMIIGIAGLVAAGFWLYENWDTVKTFFVDLWNDPLGAVQRFVSGIYEKFAPVIQWLETKWAYVKSLFGFKLVANVSTEAASGTGELSDFPGHAKGGIFDTPHLAWFAEAGPEAAIPLDGSPRALSLWAQAGEMLGVRPANAAGDINVTFAPVIHAAGGNVQEIRQMLKAAEDELIERLEAIQRQQRRLSYA